MDTPDWTQFRSADTDPAGPCCLLEKSYSISNLPRNYIWVLGEHHPWQSGEDAEITAQVKSYSREWLIERQKTLQRKRDSLIEQQAKMAQVRIKAEQERKQSQISDLKDEVAMKQKIEAGPLKMAKSLIKSAGDLATGGVTDPTARMEICNKCPFKGDDQRC